MASYSVTYSGTFIFFAYIKTPRSGFAPATHRLTAYDSADRTASEWLREIGRHGHTPRSAVELQQAQTVTVP